MSFSEEDEESNLESSKGPADTMPHRGIHPRWWVVPNDQDYYIDGVSPKNRGNKMCSIQKDP